MDDRAKLIFWLLTWVACGFAVIVGQWRSKHPSAAMPVAYVLSFTLIHFFGGLIYAFPWYEPESLYLQHSGTSLEVISRGFGVSTIGMIGFTIGCLFVAPQIVSRQFRPPKAKMIDGEQQRLPTNLMLIGVLFFVLIAPVLGAIPSIGAAAISGIGLAIAGICLTCWKAWEHGKKFRVFKWLGFTITLPFITTATLGFIGFGTAAAMSVWTFVVVFYRPRWHVVAAIVAIHYIGLSVFVTYFRDREQIRDVVWSGNKEETISEKIIGRTGKIADTFLNFEFMDFSDQEHLEYIDTRLNQNLFVAQSMDYIGGGGIDFAHGRTVWLAAIAMVPRILWPNKPVHGGSGSLVADYTGRHLSETTSFGVGQVLEFYLNFGTIGVFLGFVAFGALIRYCDIYAGRHLNEGDWWRFAAWFIIGLAFIQPGSNLAAVTAKVAATIVLVVGLYYLYYKKFYVGTQTGTGTRNRSKRPMTSGGSGGASASRKRGRPLRPTAANTAPPATEEPTPPASPPGGRPKRRRRYSGPRRGMI